MLNIIKLQFKIQRMGVIYYIIGLAVYAWMIIGLFPSFKSFDFEAYMDQMPEALQKIYAGSGVVDINTLEGFLSGEFLQHFFILITAFYVAAAAGSAIAGTIENQTIDFTLSQPISRIKLLLSHAAVGLINSALIVFASALIMKLLSEAYDSPLKISGLLAFSVVATLILWAFYGIALLVSSVLRSKIAVISTTLGIVLALIVLEAMVGVVDRLKDYQKYSLLHYYQPADLLKNAEINERYLLALLLILITTGALSLLIFKRRDI